MSVRIDLDAYALEVEAFAALADDFVDRGAAPHLQAMARDLRTGIDDGKPQWAWQSRGSLRFGPSTQYDGPGRVFGDTMLELEFSCRFLRPATVKKRCPVWNLELCTTRGRLLRDGADFGFHFDYKNPGQWGPQTHFQVAEVLSQFPIPRLVASAFLPTDCADVLLSELHPTTWIQAQHRDSYRASLLRDGQEGRTQAFLQDVARQWTADRKATRFAMLQRYTASVSALPDHRGRQPVFT